MDQSTHEVRLAYWKKVATQCQARPEGMSASAWLKQNGIPEKQYYYWLRKVRSAAYEEMKSRALPEVSETASPVSFTEIPISEESSVLSEPVSSFQPDAVIRYHGATVALSNQASSELIEKILEAVGYAR